MAYHKRNRSSISETFLTLIWRSKPHNTYNIATKWIFWSSVSQFPVFESFYITTGHFLITILLFFFLNFTLQKLFKQWTLLIYENDTFKGFTQKTGGGVQSPTPTWLHHPWSGGQWFKFRSINKSFSFCPFVKVVYNSPVLCVLSFLTCQPLKLSGLLSLLITEIHSRPVGLFQHFFNL